MRLLRRCPRDPRARTEPAVECVWPGGEGRPLQLIQLGGQPPWAWGCCVRTGSDAHEVEKGSLSQRSTTTLRPCLPETVPPSGPARKDQGLEGATVACGDRCLPSLTVGPALLSPVLGPTGSLEVLTGKAILIQKCPGEFALVTQVVKNLPAMQESWVRPLGQEDPREKGMATHSSILARRIPRTEEPGGLQSMGSQRVRHD